MNSTPATPASIIRFTAFTPAPPTPTTRRTGFRICGAGGACRPSPPSSSVLRNSAARGPSRMLARLPLAILEDLSGEFSVGICRLPIWVVLEHGHSLDRRLGEAHGLRDPRGEDPVPEVLLEELDGLLRVHRPRVDQRGQDALDLDVWVE